MATFWQKLYSLGKVGLHTTLLCSLTFIKRKNSYTGAWKLVNFLYFCTNMTLKHHHRFSVLKVDKEKPIKQMRKRYYTWSFIYWGKWSNGKSKSMLLWVSGMTPQLAHSTVQNSFNFAMLLGFIINCLLQVFTGHLYWIKVSTELAITKH